MARFVRANDCEPLMKLERPTPASSQSTAHVINAAFSEVLSTKPHDAQAVNNLAVSKRGERDYHDHFVDQLTSVSQEYTQRLAVLSQLQRHLVQARARALADDEKSLSSITELCPNYSDLNLPQGPSLFRRHLDEELLARNSLLVPSHYLPAQPAHYKPPQETAPSYLNTTLAASKHLHSKGQPVDTLPTKQTSRPVWQSTMSTGEREAEKAALSKLHRKANYLKSSRYSKTKWSNTASSGPVKLRQLDSSTAEESGSFIAEPGEVQFTDYSVGETYETTLELKNISAVSRQLRLVPLASQYFKISPVHCPTEDGLIAPGLTASYLVSFTPDSLENYQDQLKFLSCNEEEVVVQLVGYRPPPILNIPSVLEAGHCLAGGTRTTSLEIANTGGEGVFSLTSPDNNAHNSQLLLGPFTLSPAQFQLPANDGVIPFTIVFTPDKGIGEYCEEFSIACDNGQVMSFTVRGVAEKVSLGCVSTGEVGPSRLALLDEAEPELILNPCLNFDPVNPHNSSTRELVLRNFGNVQLAYEWRFFRPITEGPHWKTPDTPLADQPSPSEEPQFSVSPSVGVLGAQESNKFTFSFSPDKAGDVVDMGYLVLSGVETDGALEPALEGTGWLRLSQSQVALLCVQLVGEVKEYRVELQPPAMLIPYKLPLSTDNSKRVKLVNNSLASVQYQWSSVECERVSIATEPCYGSIGPGGEADIEVCISTRNQGVFECTLSCNLGENCACISLPISGQVEGPLVSLSAPCLDFGLVPVGTSSTQSFKLVSHSNCSLSFDIRQLVKPKESFIDFPCLRCTPYEGELVPNGSATVSVDCLSSGPTGSLNTLLQVLVNGQPLQHVVAVATLDCPRVLLSQSALYLGDCYVGIESCGEVVMSNRSPVPAQFSWSSVVCGEGVRVRISPMTGRLGPRESTTLTIHSTWKLMSPESEAIVCCQVLDMADPLYLKLSARVLGLSVEFSEPLELDLGSCNKLGRAVSTSVTVSNTSGVPSSLEAGLLNFPPAALPTPPADPRPDDGKGSRGRGLLSRTVEKTTKQVINDHSSMLLRGGSGVCFVVEPSTTSLPAFTEATLRVTAHSNMWGQYRDQLVCKVAGLSDVVVPISYGCVGCPIVFQSTATAGYTLARIGSHPPGAGPVRRVLKLKNTSPVDIRVDWKMYNIIPDNGKYVDLIMAIGDPFPKKSAVLGTSLNGVTSNTQLSSQNSANELAALSESPVGNKDLISALIQPHEGVPSPRPFDILPKQMLLPAHGVGTVEVTFQPTVEALNELGSSLASYSLGYLSLDEQTPANVHRLSGYDVRPIRIDLLAEIEHAKLLLHSDESDGLDFTYPASVLLHTPPALAEEKVLTHHFTLINATTSVAVFKLSTATEYFLVSNVQFKPGHTATLDQSITLKPQKSITFDVSYTVRLEDMKCSEECFKSTDTLRVLHTSGALQEFPLSASIACPFITQSSERIDFGVAHAGTKPAVAHLVLSNPSTSDAQWATHISPDVQEVITLEPSSGVLPCHLARGKISSQLLEIKFTPRWECSVSGSVEISELVTGRTLAVAITGTGSADEKYIPKH